jgi:hypothetical protein
MHTAVKLAGLVAMLPSALACLAYTGGLPTPTSTKTNSKVIEVAAGQVYDGGWAKFDRGSGACKGQTEGGKIYALPCVRKVEAEILVEF